MKPRHKRPGGRIVACYDYRDERGQLLFQVRRHTPKGFTVLSLTGRNVNPQSRYRRIPYRLPELLVSDLNQTVFVVEGEKDVDRLYLEGCIATCNAFGGGKGKWMRGHSRYLRGRKVVILPDNDATGAEHGRAVAKALYCVAASVRVVNLRGLPQKGDISDWLDAGHGLDELHKLVEGAPQWRPPLPEHHLPEPDWDNVYGSDYNATCTAQYKRRAIYGLPISPAAKLLLILLAEYDNPTQNELAPYVGVTPRRLRQVITGLKAKGILQVSRRGRRSVYSIHAQIW